MTATTIEALNGCIKHELYIDFELFKSGNIDKAISEFFHYFNQERLAFSLKCKTPVQVRLELGFEK